MTIDIIQIDRDMFCWANNTTQIEFFIKTIESTINEKIRHRGYVYLNQIYESLHAPWNPQKENPVFTTGPIQLTIRSTSIKYITIVLEEV